MPLPSTAEVLNALPGDREPSSWREGRVDQNGDALAILDYLWDVNPDHLGAVRPPHLGVCGAPCVEPRHGAQDAPSPSFSHLSLTA